MLSPSAEARERLPNPASNSQMIQYLSFYTRKRGRSNLTGLGETSGSRRVERCLAMGRHSPERRGGGRGAGRRRQGESHKDAGRAKACAGADAGKYLSAAGGDVGDPWSLPAPSSHQDLLLCSCAGYHGRSPDHPYPLDLHHRDGTSPPHQRHHQRHHHRVSPGLWGTGWARGRTVGSHCLRQHWVPLSEGAQGDTQGLHLSARAFGSDAVAETKLRSQAAVLLCLPPHGWLQRGWGRAATCRALQNKAPALGRREPAPLLSSCLHPQRASPECPGAQRGPALPPGCRRLCRAPLRPAQEEGR